MCVFFVWSKRIKEKNWNFYPLLFLPVFLPSPPTSTYEILHIVEGKRNQRVHNIGIHKREEIEKEKSERTIDSIDREREQKAGHLFFFFSVWNLSSSSTLDRTHHLSSISIYIFMVLLKIWIFVKRKLYFQWYEKPIYSMMKNNKHHQIYLECHLIQ